MCAQRIKDEVRSFHELKRDSRLSALQRLPSRNLTITKFDQLTHSQKETTTAVESYKIRRGSSMVRHIEKSDVPEMAKMLEFLDENESELQPPMDQLREMNVSIAIKREIKDRFYALKKMQEHPRMDYMQHKLRVKNFLRTIFYYLELWRSKIKTIHGRFGSGTASYFIFLRWQLKLNILNFLVILACIAIPQLLFELNWDITPPYTPFSFSDIFTGGGWIENSLLYYGRYSNETKSKYSNYNRPRAYVTTVGVLYIINFIVIIQSLASAYKKTSRIGAKKKVAFCHKVFCSWDYAMEDPNAANLKKECTCRELLELLCSLHGRKKMNIKNRMAEIMFAIFLNVFILALFCGLGYMVFSFQNFLVNDVYVTDVNASVTMAAITATFYIFLMHLSKLEYFVSKENHLYITAIRVAVMRTIIVAFLAYFWIQSGNIASPSECFENEHGREVYQFIVMNFLFMSGLYMMMLFLWKIATSYSTKFASIFPPPHFDAAFQINDLIYYQTLIWVGFFHGPMLSSLLIVIAVLNFYGLYYTIMYCCEPDIQASLPSFAQTLFVLITFIGLLISMMRIGYTWNTVIPSRNCGPFRGGILVRDIIENYLNEGVQNDSILASLIEIIQTPIFIFSTILILCVPIYFLQSFSRAEDEVRKHLEAEIASVGKDKAFLLSLYENSLYEDMKQSKKVPKKPAKKKK